MKHVGRVCRIVVIVIILLVGAGCPRPKAPEPAAPEARAGLWDGGWGNPAEGAELFLVVDENGQAVVDASGWLSCEFGSGREGGRLKPVPPPDGWTIDDNGGFVISVIQVKSGKEQARISGRFETTGTAATLEWGKCLVSMTLTRYGPPPPPRLDLPPVLVRGWEDEKPIDAVQLIVEQSYTDMSEYHLPIAEIVEEALRGMGLTVVGATGNAPVTLTIDLVGRPIGAEYKVISGQGSDGFLYTGAEAQVTTTLVGGGRRMLRHHTSAIEEPPFMPTGGPESPEQAPIPEVAWAGIIDGLTRLLGAPVLVELFGNQGQRELSSSIEAALEELGADVVPLAVEALRDSARRADTRADAASMLGRLGRQHPDAVPVLLEVHRDRREDVRVRAAAASALGRIESASARVVPALIEALDDPSCHVRSGAAGTLGRMGRQAMDAVPALIARLELYNTTPGHTFTGTRDSPKSDPSWALDVYKRALERITGEKRALPMSSGEWKAWWEGHAAEDTPTSE